MAKARKGVSLAQSGGINRTFGGGKGGTAQSKPVTKGRKIGSGKMNNGLNYNVRTEGGNATLVPAKFKAGKTPPLSGGSAGTKIHEIKVRPPFKQGSR